MRKHSSLKRFITLLGFFALLPTFIPVGVAVAGTPKVDSNDVRLHIDEKTIERGYTIHKPGGDFTMGIFPHVLDREATVYITDADAAGTVDLQGWTRVSEVYEFDIRTDPIKIFAKEVIIEVAYTSDTTKTKRIHFWDSNWQQWRPLRSVNLLDVRRARAFTHLPYSKVAVFEEDATREGIASWYRDTRAYTASSNDYAIGSTVRVTNVENGASVVVKIVSTGPFVAGRVIDLEHTAFAALADPAEGVAKVVVEPTDDAAGQTSGAVPSSTTPSINGATGIVWDPQSGTTLYDKNADTVRTIASITKIATALTFLEANPDWDKVMTITDDDHPQPIPGVEIAVGPGDTITVRDLFEAMLTGSANNAAYALVRSTGLSRDVFVTKMNDLAKRLGMTTAHFVEPSGLNTENKASARDLAKLFEYASHRLGLSQVTVQGTDSYTKLNTGEVRTIKNPVYLASGLNDKPLRIAKTGYLDESLYNLGVKVRGSDGKERIIVVLGSGSRASRNNDVARLIDWSLN
ncbi:MAG: serine hydrolase [Patescibacteria group bacterium]|jgi:D-alanyl-D-alanine endopeptidase (penicillin-binding protein 7)